MRNEFHCKNLTSDQYCQMLKERGFRIYFDPITPIIDKDQNGQIKGLNLSLFVENPHDIELMEALINEGYSKPKINNQDLMTIFEAPKGEYHNYPLGYVYRLKQW